MAKPMKCSSSLFLQNLNFSHTSDHVFFSELNVTGIAKTELSKREKILYYCAVIQDLSENKSHTLLRLLRLRNGGAGFNPSDSKSIDVLAYY